MPVGESVFVLLAALAGSQQGMRHGMPPTQFVEVSLGLRRFTPNILGHSLKPRPAFGPQGTATVYLKRLSGEGRKER